MHILTLPHVGLKCFIYTPEFSKKSFLKFFTKVTISLFEGFKQKEIFFNVTLIINTFLSKSIKKTLYKLLESEYAGYQLLVIYNTNQGKHLFIYIFSIC